MKIVEGKLDDYRAYVKRNSEDGYGKAVIEYSERWADLMEAELEAGKLLVDIAESTSHSVDTEGITGFMYGCAVRGLSTFWVYGEELRKWHNKEYGVPNSEGVVNPACMTIAMED